MYPAPRVIRFTFVVITLVSKCYGLANSCSAVKTLLGATSVDGEYCLSFGESIATIYCHDMDTSAPKEYITLSAGPDNNFGKRVHGTSTTNQANFEKIRLNVNDMKVVTNDYTFATKVSTGFPFGSAESCTGVDGSGNYIDLGSMKIDLSGTGFALNQSVEFGKAGYYPYYGELEHFAISSNRQVVECSAGGECAGCYPNGDPDGYDGSIYGSNGVIKLTVFGQYFTGKTKHSCLEMCARIPSCISVYFNDATGDCFTQEDKLSCTGNLGTRDFVFEKEDRDGQSNANLISAYFTNIKSPSDV